MPRTIAAVLMSALFLTASLPSSAAACGGFFCDNSLVPVDQSKERILFRVNGDGTITTFVEISYTGEPEQFAWVIPTPVALDTADIEIRGPELFDELEAATRPRFRVASKAGGSADALYGSSCGCGPQGWGDDSFPTDFGWLDDYVEVLDTLAIGPFNLEVIESDDAQNFNAWLAVNGYATTAAADQYLQHYIDAGMAFLGVKLNPKAVSGPLDTLVFTYPAGDPMIPIILTQIAAVPDMEILTYVLADQAYRPGNYDELDFDYNQVEMLGEGESNYEGLLPGAVDKVGGHAFITEFSNQTRSIGASGDSAAELLATGSYLTRMRTYMSADEMNIDPMFSAAPAAPNVSNEHDIYIVASKPAHSGPQPILFGLLPLGLLGLRRRR